MFFMETSPIGGGVSLPEDGSEPINPDTGDPYDFFSTRDRGPDHRFGNIERDRAFVDCINASGWYKNSITSLGMGN